MNKWIRRIVWILPFSVLWACGIPPAADAISKTPIPVAAADIEPLIPPTTTFTELSGPKTPAHPTTPTVTLANTKTQTIESAESPSNAALPYGIIRVKLGVVNFVIPSGLASSATLSTTTREEWPAVNPSLGPFPEHWVITLHGYLIPKTDIIPEIIIFHADEFAEFADYIIEGLRELQSRPNDPVPQTLLMPGFCAHVFKLPSQNGMGFRYLTQFFMDYFPVNNEDMFYYYVGLSTDGGYYISMRMPVNASFLPADSDVSALLPEGGIPFPKNVDEASFFEYVTLVNTKINNTKADEFNPSLLSLDALARSIRIQT
ncbi:MAG: hypothetical protein WBM17_17385 [Anaerolineales bacterium]